MEKISTLGKSFVLVCIFLVCSCHSNNVNNDRENDWLINMSDQYKRDNNPGEILVEVQLFLEDYPKSFLGWNFAAILHLAVGQDSLASECLNKSLNINDSTNYGAFTNKAIILDKLGLHDEAYEYYKKSIRVNPEYPQAYSNLMSNRMKSGQLDSAVYFGEISVKLADNIGDNGVLCALYHKVGLYDKRDSLYSILKHLEYVNLDKLEEVIAPR